MEGTTPWDKGKSHSFLVEFLDSPDAEKAGVPTSGRALVPGCGQVGLFSLSLSVPLFFSLHCYVVLVLLGMRIPGALQRKGRVQSSGLPIRLNPAARRCTFVWFHEPRRLCCRVPTHHFVTNIAFQ